MYYISGNLGVNRVRFKLVCLSSQSQICSLSPLEGVAKARCCHNAASPR
jgi:hypothetical protein